MGAWDFFVQKSGFWDGKCDSIGKRGGVKMSKCDDYFELEYDELSLIFVKRQQSEAQNTLIRLKGLRNMMNQQIAHELSLAETKENIGIVTRFKIADLLTKRNIAIEITKMFKETPGLTEAEYLRKATDIYYKMGGHLVPDGEEE